MRCGAELEGFTEQVIEKEARRLERERLAAMLPDKWRSALIEDEHGFKDSWIAMPRDDYDRIRDLARSLREAKPLPNPRS